MTLPTVETRPVGSVSATNADDDLRASFVRAVSPVWQRLLVDLRLKATDDEVAALLPAVSRMRQRIVNDHREATRNEVIKCLGTMLACMTGNKQDNAIYAKVLQADVIEEKPSIGAIEVACRRLRQTQTFTPSIAEVLTAVREAQREVRSAFVLLQQAEKIINERT